jgi:hypothetical protein
MKVTLRRALMVCVLALILAAMTAGTASAAPKTVDPGTLTPPPDAESASRRVDADRSVEVCSLKFPSRRYGKSTIVSIQRSAWKVHSANFRFTAF